MGYLPSIYLPKTHKLLDNSGEWVEVQNLQDGDYLFSHNFNWKKPEDLRKAYSLV